MSNETAFARNIKALREDNELTQEEFGKSLNLGNSTVPKWERGLIVRPRPSMLNAIAEMYEISVDDLVSENGYYAKSRELERGRESEPHIASLPQARTDSPSLTLEMKRIGRKNVRKEQHTAFSKNVRALREDKKLTQAQFGERLGVSTNTVSRWEIKGVQPRLLMLEHIASEYGVTTENLLSENGYYAKTRGLERTEEPKASATSLLIAGAEHAGDPSQVFEVEGEEQWCPPEYAREGNFYVRVTGDSMNNCLMDGQCALVDTHSEVGSGDIALVKVDGDDATIKRVKLLDGIVVLEPDSTNPAHRRRIIDGTDPDSPEVRLIGKVVYAVTRL